MVHEQQKEHDCVCAGQGMQAVCPVMPCKLHKHNVSLTGQTQRPTYSFWYSSDSSEKKPSQHSLLFAL